jgi:hypothetical protein
MSHARETIALYISSFGSTACLPFPAKKIKKAFGQFGMEVGLGYHYTSHASSSLGPARSGLSHRFTER